MENLGLEMRKQVARYLAGEISIAEFQTHLAPLTWNVERRADPEVAAIAHELDLRLAEFSHGDWTEPELQAHLSPFVTSYSVTTGDRFWTSNSTHQVFSTQMASPAQGQLLSVGIQFEVASA